MNQGCGQYKRGSLNATMQADVQLLLGRRGDFRGLRDGIVESIVIFTQIAAAEIRSTVQQLVQSASGVRSCVHPNLTLVHPNLSMDLPTSVSLTGSPRKNMQLMQNAINAILAIAFLE